MTESQKTDYWMFILTYSIPGMSKPHLGSAANWTMQLYCLCSIMYITGLGEGVRVEKEVDSNCVCWTELFHSANLQTPENKIY